MNFLSFALFAVQISAAIFGLYNEFAPNTYPARSLPPGMGYSLAIISFTMGMVLLFAERERDARQKQIEETAIHRRISNRLSTCVTVHEREFYALWPEQVKRAKNNVDITHLGPRPPQIRHGQSEGEYFADLKTIYNNSNALIRRVERHSDEKMEWISKLAKEFSGLNNVSFAVYKDPFKTEMPAALSVCRVDDNYAWLIAVAEHESTGNYRDIMLTGADNVDLIKRYFQDRLWNRSVVVVNRGVFNANWKAELKI